MSVGDAEGQDGGNYEADPRGNMIAHVALEWVCK